MSVAPVIHIGGWPGAGKRAIGRLVADRLSGRLIHNHLMLDAARAIYERGTPGSIQMREDVRAVIMEHARALPDDVPIVLTDALADEPISRPLLQHTFDLAASRKAPLRFFILDLTLEENIRRLTNPERRGSAKLLDAGVLGDLRDRHKLLIPDGAVVMDVSDMTAQDAAGAIYAQIEGQHG